MVTFTQDALIVAAVCAGVTILLFSYRKVKDRGRKKNILNDPVVSKCAHQWSAEPWMNKGFWCSMCEQPLTGGYVCNLCRVRVDEKTCLQLASKTIPCKVNATSMAARALKHHWVLGNMDPEDFCSVCREPTGEELGLNDFWCAWCGRSVHTDCKERVRLECDRGVAAASVIPPNALVTRKAGSRNQKTMVIESVTAPPDVRKFQPLIVIFNPKSGSGAGEAVAKAFGRVLHPMQIVDVTKVNMKTTLLWLNDHPHITARIIIAGGDGTISLVLDDIDSLTNRPAVSILPLGTGNDLSRILNWGAESDGIISTAELYQLIRNVQEAEVQPLDRWTVSIESPRRLGMRPNSRSLSMTNYVSIGVDACVTLGMQSTRQSLPRALSSRLLNKMLFFAFGTKDLLSRACKGLQNQIELELDGERMELPEIEGLIFLNIQCWGAGVKVWQETSDDLQKQSIEDGKFEVFAVQSSFHIAKLQVGLSSPIRIGQASRATLTVRRGCELPMQSDGEAWKQKAATITIQHKGRSNMLRNIVRYDQ